MDEDLDNNEEDNTQETSEERDGDNQSEPGLQQGLTLCRYVSEHLSNELQTWQEKFDNTRQTNRILKQNIVDLENEKQRILLKFEKDYHQYVILNIHVTKLEEKIETIRRFLENISALEEDIKNSKIIEQKVIGNVIDTFHELCEDETLFVIEHSLEDEKNYLQKRVEEVANIMKEIGNCSAVESELNDGIVACAQRIASLKLCEVTSNELSSIRNKIDEISAEINAETCKTRRKHQNLKLQIKLEIDLMRSQVQFFKERMKNEYIKKNNVIKEWETKCTKLKNSGECLGNKIVKINTRIGDLMERKKKIGDELGALQSKNESLKNELKARRESLLSYLINIREFESVLQVRIKTENELNKAKIEKKNLRKKLVESGNLASLCKNLKNLRDSHRTNTEKIQQLKNTIFNLTAKKDEVSKTLESTFDEIHREENEITLLKNLTDEMKLEDIIDSGKESIRLNDSLKCDQAEKNSLLKASEAEIDSLRARKLALHSKYESSRIEVTRINQENDLLHDEIIEKKKSLKIVKDDREFYNNTIRKIKRNVLQHNYVTMQDLNNKLKAMVNSKNIEKERVVKLKEEIRELKEKVDSKKKKNQNVRRLHQVEDDKTLKIQKTKFSK